MSRICLLIATLLTFFPKAYPHIDGIKKLMLALEDSDRFLFIYQHEPVATLLGTSFLYKSIRFSLESRYFGDIEIWSYDKENLGTASLYEFSGEIGYKETLGKNFRYGFTIFGKYEYYYFFSEVYIGGSTEIGFHSRNFRLLGILGITDKPEFNGIASYTFWDGGAEIGTGWKLNLNHQDIFIFLSSRVIRYEDLSTSILSGGYYGTLKGICPFFEVQLRYKNFLISWGISFQESIGTFQLWGFGANM